jgi:hypothetical protein
MKHEAMSLVNDVERIMPVARWRMHGVQLWPIIRCRLIWAAFDDSVGQGWARGGALRRIVRRAGAAFRSTGCALSDLARGPALRSPTDAVIVTDGVATTQIGTSAYDVVADPLTELIADAGATVQTWYTTYACPAQRRTEGVLLQWRLDAAQLGMAKIRDRDGQPAALNGYEEFLSMVRAAGLPQQAVALGEMSRLAARIAVMAECFGKWLSATTPRLVFVNCYYSLEGAALMLACMRRGIVSIDVQHGVQGEQHVAYGRWINVPSSGYELLPEHFWCWSELEVRAIRSWAEGRTNRHSAFVGGNPWMEMWQDERSPFVAAADEAVRAVLHPERRTILVTLQWGMTDQTFLTPLLELIATAGKSWTWWLRLHPVMRTRRRQIKAMLHARGLRDVLLDEPSDFALPALLKHSDVHLTYSSSTVLEAAALGVASVVISPASAAYFPDLVRDGLVLELDSLKAEVVMPALATMSLRKRTTRVGGLVQGRTAIRRLLAGAQPQTATAAGSSA